MRECIEKEWLPFSLYIGVTYELFWKLNPRRLEPFLLAHEKSGRANFIKQNESAWLMGLYVRSAIASVFSVENKYFEKPIDFNLNDSEKKSNQKMEEHVANFREYVIALNVQRKKMKEMESESDARN